MNGVAFLDFPNAIGPNRSHSDCETDNFAGVTLKTMHPLFYSRNRKDGIGYGGNYSHWQNGDKSPTIEF